MDNDRLKHSIAVARKMVEISKLNGMSEEDVEICFIIGYNHDIGYEYTKNGINHNKIGGKILKKMGFKYWQDIYYHGIVDTKYRSKYLDILNQADMQIDKYGNDVGYIKRLEDIKNRYGEQSSIYMNCEELINKLIER